MCWIENLTNPNFCPPSWGDYPSPVHLYGSNNLKSFGLNKCQAGKGKNCGGKVNFRAIFPKERCHKIICVGSKLLGFRISETPKNGEGNPNFESGFPNGNPEKMA